MAGLWLMLMAGPAMGQSRAARTAVALQYQQLAALGDTDNSADDDLGWSSAMSGNTAVLGKPGDSATQTPGAAYVYEKPASGWQNAFQTAKLTASDGVARAGFGWSVAIDGDTVVVGASPWNGTPSTVVYVFVKPAGGWHDVTETARLTLTSGDNAQYGYSVGVSGDTIAANGFSPDYSEGAVHVFEKPAGGWTDMTQTATLTDSRKFDSLGWTVAVSGDVIASGAPEFGKGRGAVVVFKKPTQGWQDRKSPSALLTATDGAPNAILGYALAMQGSTIASSSPNAGIAGAAYVFEEGPTGWKTAKETAKLTSGLLGSVCYGDNFGGAVGVSGSTVAVGASLTSIGDPCSLNANLFVGAVYLYEKPPSGWTNQNWANQKLEALYPGSYVQMGWSVAVGTDAVIAGGPGSESNRGIGFVFGP
jgi:hypothetical protein